MINPSASSTCCVAPGCGKPVFKYTRGVMWNNTTDRSLRYYGNALCSKCWKAVQKDVGDFRPRPGFSKPPAFIVAARRFSKRIKGPDAITLAICYGNWLKAVQIRDAALSGSTFKKESLQCSIWSLSMPVPVSIHDPQPVAPLPLAIATPIPIAVAPPTFLQLQSLQKSFPTVVTEREDHRTITNRTSLCPKCGRSCTVLASGRLRNHRNPNNLSEICE